MPPGKLASQSGHAFLNAYLASMEERPEVSSYYQRDGLGTKVCLKAKNEQQLLATYQLAKSHGIPCSLIVDQHHIMPPHFTGDPIITALGIGPAKKSEVAFLKRFSLWQ